MECWQKARLNYAMQEVEYAPDWLLEKMATGNTEEKENVAMISWGIWFARNQKVWEDKIINPTTIVEISLKQKRDWQEASKAKQAKVAAMYIKPVEVVEITCWKPPREG